MEPVTYDSCDIYIQSVPKARQRLARLEAVIDALEASLLKGAGKANFSEYWMDDGQTKIKTVYRNANDVIAAIENIEKLRQIYINRINGRRIRLVPGKNF